LNGGHGVRRAGKARATNGSNGGKATADSAPKEGTAKAVAPPAAISTGGSAGRPMPAGATPVSAEPPAPAAAARAEPPGETPAAPTAPTKPSAAPVAVAPYCPYCALLLDPPPEVSRRCRRCLQRIIVKRVDGRAVYLTEASVAVFDAERRRIANAGRWTRERRRWLTAAAEVGAPAVRIAKLDQAPVSESVVAASRALYVTTVDGTVRVARHERRWDDAAQILRDHAMTLFRIAGSPIPPPEEILQPHREAAAASLRGLEDVARAAELVSGRCCEICRADDGRIFRIANELRTPRLPHEGCPQGLCRCDWYLPVDDGSIVLRQLRRRARAVASMSRRGG
jgi:hypothetical protein